VRALHQNFGLGEVDYVVHRDLDCRARPGQPELAPTVRLSLPYRLAVVALGERAPIKKAGIEKVAVPVLRQLLVRPPVERVAENERRQLGLGARNRPVVVGDLATGDGIDQA